MEIISSADALLISTKNGARTWAHAAKPRLEKMDSYFTVEHTPKWRLSPDDVIFTMGSCFARNVENVLTARGAKLALTGHGVAIEHYESFDDTGDTRTGVSRGALNKYTTASMYHDLRRVLNEEQYPNEGLIELGTNRWFDPHASALKHAPFEVALENRKAIARAVMTVRDSSVVFMTLGLTEGWIDKETGLAMNRHPGVASLRRRGDRFQFVSYSYDDVLADIKSIIALLREVRPNMKVALTVSPVPFGATWRPLDVVVANTYSKSTLRAAIDAVAKDDPFVDYFPSYEIVINSPRHLAWINDQIHVQPEMVNHVMKLFQDTYMGTAE